MHAPREAGVPVQQSLLVSHFFPNHFSMRLDNVFAHICPVSKPESLVQVFHLPNSRFFSRVHPMLGRSQWFDIASRQICKISSVICSFLLLFTVTNAVTPNSAVNLADSKQNRLAAFILSHTPQQQLGRLFNLLCLFGNPRWQKLPLMITRGRC